MSAAADHAPAIAAFLVEPSPLPRRDFDLQLTLAERWPAATDEEVGRGLLMAAQLIDARLAELATEDAAAAYAGLSPDTRARMAADVAGALRGVTALPELPAALARIFDRWPCLPGRILVDAAAASLAPNRAGEA